MSKQVELSLITFEKFLRAREWAQADNALRLIDFDTTESGGLPEGVIAGDISAFFDDDNNVDMAMLANLLVAWKEFQDEVLKEKNDESEELRDIKRSLTGFGKILRLAKGLDVR